MMKTKQLKLDVPVDFYPDFYNAKEVLELFEQSKKLQWERGVMNMYGKTIPVPREEALYGDDLNYAYRGEKLSALPWPDMLREMRGRIEKRSGFKFNFAVGNRYITGKDSIGWHSDSFPVIGKRPPIASVSLGGTRRFKLKHKETKETVDFELESGSLLIMLPGCQEEWLHAIPKTAKEVDERINWTFRPHIDG